MEEPPAAGAIAACDGGRLEPDFCIGSIIVSGPLSSSFFREEEVSLPVGLIVFAAVGAFDSVEG